jgi:cytochrome P450
MDGGPPAGDQRALREKIAGHGYLGAVEEVVRYASPVIFMRRTRSR